MSGNDNQLNSSLLAFCEGFWQLNHKRIGRNLWRHETSGILYGECYSHCGQYQSPLNCSKISKPVNLQITCSICMFIAPSIRFFTRHLDHVEIHIDLGAECMTLTEVALLLLSLAAEGLVLFFSLNLWGFLGRNVERKRKDVIVSLK